jgi:hypothetical protein
MTDERFRMQMVFPVDGDSAIVELTHDGGQWAEIRLEGLRLDAVGEDRLRGAQVVLTLHPPAERPVWEFDHADAVAQLQEARAWLEENERGRQATPGRPGAKVGRWQPEPES